MFALHTAFPVHLKLNARLALRMAYSISNEVSANAQSGIFTGWIGDALPSHVGNVSAAMRAVSDVQAQDRLNVQLAW